MSFDEPEAAACANFEQIEKAANSAAKVGSEEDPSPENDLEEHIGQFSSLIWIKPSPWDCHLTVTKMADCNRWQG